MLISFTKMQALGNDFVVIDATTTDIALSEGTIRRIADRHFGIGCDQILVLRVSAENGVDFGYSVFNADGSEVYQCGNGVRCLARFVKSKNLSKKDELVFATKTTKAIVSIASDGQVTAKMQAPIFEPKSIPMLIDHEDVRYSLVLENGTVLKVGAVFVGNPHAVILVSEIGEAQVEDLGALISNSRYFPEKANVNFMQILDRRHINLRVYERGTGETLACGSGAVAAVAVGRLWGFLESNVMVESPGGRLMVDLGEHGGDEVFVTGPACQVYVGEMVL